MPTINLHMLVKCLKKHLAALYEIYVDTPNISTMDSILDQMNYIEKIIQQIEETLD
jgi:hypothetical protein